MRCYFLYKKNQNVASMICHLQNQDFFFLIKLVLVSSPLVAVFLVRKIFTQLYQNNNTTMKNKNR